MTKKGLSGRSAFYCLTQSIAYRSVSLGEVVALFRRPNLLEGTVAAVDRRRVLVGLASDEAVEVLEPNPVGVFSALNGPIVGLSSQTGTSWALAELAVK